jgi:hypothetical protein
MNHVGGSTPHPDSLGNGSIMERAAYRVRLYGHTAENPEVFCNDLAQLLGISVEEAHGLLNVVPAVVAETRKLEQAEYLRHRLTGIRALALVDGPEALDMSVGATATAQTRGHGPMLAAEASEKKDNLMARIWMILLVAVAGLALLVGSIVFLVQFRRMLAQNVPATTPQTVAPRSEQPAARTPDPSEIEAKRRRRIQALKDQISELKFQASWQKDMLHQQEARRPIDYEEMRRLKVRLAATEEQIAAAFRELQKVRGR